MIIGICGNSGSGKSTLANQIVKLTDNKAIHLEIDKIGHKVLLLPEVKKELVKLYENKILSENNIDTESKVIIQENVSQFALEGKYLYFIEGDYNRYKNSKLLAKDLLSNEIYYIDENVLSINVSENVMRYSTDDTNWFDVFSPEKYEKINE